MWRLIGLSAACLTMFGFVPQIIKIVRLKSSRDVSLTTLGQFALGSLLWIIYALRIRDEIIILANSVTFASSAILIVLYLHYRRRV